MNKVPEEKPVVQAPVIPESQVEPIIPVPVIPAPAVPVSVAEESIDPVATPVIPVAPIVNVITEMPTREVAPEIEELANPVAPAVHATPRQKPITKKHIKRKKPAKKKKPAPKKRSTRLAEPAKDGHHRMEIQSAQWVAGDRKTDRREERTKRMLARQKQGKQKQGKQKKGKQKRGKKNQRSKGMSAGQKRRKQLSE